MKYIGALSVLLILVAIAMKNWPAPYFWIGLASIVLLGLLVLIEKNIKCTVVFINLILICAILTTSEFYLWAPFAQKVWAQGNMWQPQQYVKDEIRGYCPPRNATGVFGKKYYGDSLIYDMQFSTDQNGLRATYTAKQPEKDVLFFGCSFTFGDGLNDNQTLPYLLSLRGKERIQTYNLAYSGYGPHQMLSILENRFEEKLMSDTTRPKFAIYTALPGHIVRSAGLASWVVTRHDPRYEINANGEIYHAGHFDVQAIDIDFKTRLKAYLSNAYILKKLYPPFAYNRKRMPNEHDLDKYVKIVVKARDIFEQRYPGAEFHVVLWNLEDAESDKAIITTLIKRFCDNNIRLHEIKDILPGYYQNNPYYQIVHDRHPTPYANEIIADYILSKVVRF